MIKKTITYLLLISLIYTINLKTVEAFTISFPHYFDEEASDEENDGWIEGTTWEISDTAESKIDYQCYFEPHISIINNITAEGFNPDNEPMFETSLNIPEEDRVIAGTSVGISLIERKKVDWSINVKVEKQEYEKTTTYSYNCYYNQITASGGSTNPISPTPVPWNSIFTFSRIQNIAFRGCPILRGYTTCPQLTGPSSNCYLISREVAGSNTTTSNEAYITECTGRECERYRRECQREAAAAVSAMATAAMVPSVTIELPDSNDINATNKIKIESVACEGTCDLTAAFGELSGSGTAIFNYKKPKACINVKTSNVSYKSGPCSDSEIEIKNDIIDGEEHWHYFIPLNAKSDTSIDINVLPAGGGNLKPKQCIYVMENYGIDKETPYNDLIIKKNGDNFEGVPRIDEQEMKTNGCKLTAKIKIYPKQKFYNEDKNAEGEKIFKGFNFYYKPINIETPFPNGLTNGSLWKEWNDKYTSGKNENPRIIESFDESNLTYETKGINLTKIREYNQNNKYTNWGNMMQNGRSKFIEQEGIIERKEGTTFYKLGCGPKNADWSECR